MSMCGLFPLPLGSATREIDDGVFREDLFHRLIVVPVRVPSLAERREDIPELIDFFMDHLAADSGLPRRKSATTPWRCCNHHWPGNIRQLRNVIERLMILTAGIWTRVTAECCHARSARSCLRRPTVRSEELMNLPLRDAREVFEREYLWRQINRFGGNISRTADLSGWKGRRCIAS